MLWFERSSGLLPGYSERIPSRISIPMIKSSETRVARSTVITFTVILVRHLRLPRNTLFAWGKRAPVSQIEQNERSDRGAQAGSEQQQEELAERLRCDRQTPSGRDLAPARRELVPGTAAQV